MNLPKFSKKKFLSFFCVLVVEFTLFGAIAYKIYNFYQNKRKVLGESVVVPIKQELAISSPSNDLRYFYEPPADFIEIDTIPWLNESVQYTFNSDTFNERYEYIVDKTENVYRIITLGDSFTFGQYVNTADNWPEKLEDKLNDSNFCDKQEFEVINLGVYGYDLEYSFQRFKLRGQKYKPDLVIMFLHGDRWNELMTDKRFEYEAQMTEDEKEEAAIKGSYPSWEKAMEYIQDTYSDEELLNKYREMFNNFDQFYQGPVLIVSMSNSDEKYKKRIQQIVNEREYTYFFDDIPALDSFDGLLLDGHPNERGHLRVAGEIFQFLFSDGLINCD